MAEQQTGAILTMVLLATFLASVGVWQFGSLDFGGDEHKHQNELEYENSYSRLNSNSSPTIDISDVLKRISSEKNVRVIEVEREMERGRDLYEIKIADPDGRVREVKIDAKSGKLIGGN